MLLISKVNKGDGCFSGREAETLEEASTSSKGYCQIVQYRNKVRIKMFISYIKYSIVSVEG